MMRRGALRMVFDRIRPPDGRIQPARFELTATESDSAKTDIEGTVHPTVSKKRIVIQLGGTALIAKLADDISEEALATSAGSALIRSSRKHNIPSAPKRPRGKA